MSKFLNVPVEEETSILFSLECKLDDKNVLYQKWSWSGILAESLIFINSEVESLDDEELESIVRSSPAVNEGTSITIKRSESGFTFVNFNFEAEDD